MKNIREYRRKIRKLLKGAAKARPPKLNESLHGELQIKALVEAVLDADATPRQSQRAYTVLEREFVDNNELRVAQPKEIVDCLPADFPRAKEKAEILTKALNMIFDRTGESSLAYMFKMPRKELRRHLSDLGLEPYASAALAMTLFGAPTLPVDQTLVECLQIERCAPAGISAADAQAMLERLIEPQDCYAAHLFFRKFIDRMAKPLEEKRRADAKALAKAQAAAQAKAAARAESQARAKAKLDARTKPPEAKKGVKPPEKRPTAKKTVKPVKKGS